MPPLSKIVKLFRINLLHQPLQIGPSRLLGNPHPGPVRAVHGHSLVDLKELIGLVIVLGAYGIVSVDMPLEYVQYMNVVGPTCLAAILACGCWLQLGQELRSLWQPLFWFRIACATYYGVGALVPYVANDATVLSIKAVYAFDEEEAFKVGLITVCSVLTVLLTASLFSRRHRDLERGNFRNRHGESQSNTLVFAALILIVGGVIRYLIVLPYVLSPTDVVPGVVVMLSNSYVVGLYLVVLAALRGSRIAQTLALVLIPVDLAVGLLAFAKTQVLTTLIFSFLGVLHHRLTMPRILLGAGMVIVAYSQLQPIIQFGREELLRQFGKSEATLGERLDILNSYWSGAPSSGEALELQPGLGRLSYVNVAAMVISWHDVGRTGDSLAYALFAFVPRVIWPDKPEISSVGTDLYTAATAQTGTSFSPGLFAEAYWNLGWLGIPVLMIPLGIILGIFSRYSLTVMRSENWLHLPVVLLGVQIGTRVDGWYVGDIIGACSTALAFAVAIFSIEGVLGRRSR